MRVLNGEQELFVVGLLFENPALYLSEVCLMVSQAFGVLISPPTVCRILHKHGLTRKKIKQVALQQSVEKRGKFISEVQFFHVNQFVWLDESGCNRRDQIRKFGYSLRGEPPVYHRFLHRGERISAICAMSTEGLMAYKLLKGTVNGERFLEFIQGVLIPEMQPFDGENPHSVLVLDNCSIHHTQPVTEALRQMGILTLFLPPYSPDMNPVEELFSYILQILLERS